ncbi:uncharacterized protein LOC131380778 isoform X2 [Hylobates moloch]|uniref:uncharacterized protein LOC131380778 isoform X2 n=1 Tax=Hylobates moloch TaxID=81572 RepID=UPI0026768095|nr:uncharacterized protein LOC131380778 isoform X2 [Hylobates moloch]
MGSLRSESSSSQVINLRVCTVGRFLLAGEGRRFCPIRGGACLAPPPPRYSPGQTPDNARAYPPVSSCSRGNVQERCLDFQKGWKWRPSGFLGRVVRWDSLPSGPGRGGGVEEHPEPGLSPARRVRGPSLTSVKRPEESNGLNHRLEAPSMCVDETSQLGAFQRPPQKKHSPALVSPPTFLPLPGSTRTHLAELLLQTAPLYPISASSWLPGPTSDPEKDTGT